MELLRLTNWRAIGVGASLAALAWAAPASAQLASGEVTARCNVYGSQAELYARYEVYGDSAVWTDRTTGRFADIISSGLTTTYWQGYINTSFGRFNLSGENNFIDAIPAGGYYSDKRTLEIISTGRTTFMLRDFFADNQPTFPCEITSQR